MKNKMFAGLPGVLLLLTCATPAGRAITISFDDSTERGVDFMSVTLTNAYATDQKLNITSFRLLEQANSDGTAGSISDYIVLAIDDRHPRDLIINFYSDSELGLTPPRRLPVYGSMEESGGFQTLPLPSPTDFPLPADLILKIKSDAPVVPDTSNLAAEVVAVLIGFICFRRACAAVKTRVGTEV
jgi:hypothetical protein